MLIKKRKGEHIEICLSENLLSFNKVKRTNKFQK